MAKSPFVPVVAVLNMKGGVGKTTLSANLFRRLYLRKRVSTLLLDLDPQHNLTQLVYTRQGYKKVEASGDTIRKVFSASLKPTLLEVSAKHSAVPEPSTLARMLKSTTSGERLDIVPGDFALVKFSLMRDEATLDHAKERFVKFVDKAKSQYGLVVLDCNPSSSFLTMCALSVCTHVLVPVRLDRYSVLGLEMLWEFATKILPLPKPPAFVAIINGVKPNPTKASQETENELRAHAIFGSRTLVSPIKESGQLHAPANFTGFSVDRPTSVTQKIRNMLDTAADELAGKLGIK